MPHDDGFISELKKSFKQKRKRMKLKQTSKNSMFLENTHKSTSNFHHCFIVIFYLTNSNIDFKNDYLFK